LVSKITETSHQAYIFGNLDKISMNNPG